MLDRLAKIMSYMRPSERGKNAKKLRKKDKLAMLNGLPLDEDTNRAHADGAAEDANGAGPAGHGAPPKVRPAAL